MCVTQPASRPFHIDTYILKSCLQGVKLCASASRHMCIQKRILPPVCVAEPSRWCYQVGYIVRFIVHIKTYVYDRIEKDKSSMVVCSAVRMRFLWRLCRSRPCCRGDPHVDPMCHTFTHAHVPPSHATSTSAACLKKYSFILTRQKLRLRSPS